MIEKVTNKALLTEYKTEYMDLGSILSTKARVKFRERHTIANVAADFRFISVNPPN